MQAHRLATILSVAVLFASAAKGDVALRGEGMEQLNAGDIRDIESLAAQLIPGRRLAVVDCVVSKAAGGARTVALLNVYSEPVEQTARLWRGFHFKCVLESEYRPRSFSETTKYRTLLTNATVRKSGRWLVAGTHPVDWYAVITPAGKVLPEFSSARLDLFSPCLLGTNTSSDEAVGVYDLVVISAANSGRQDLAGVAELPISCVNVGTTTAKVDLGGPRGRRVRFRLEKADSGWQIENVK